MIFLDSSVLARLILRDQPAAADDPRHGGIIDQ